jgi:hypothetical protein
MADNIRFDPEKVLFPYPSSIPRPYHGRTMFGTRYSSCSRYGPKNVHFNDKEIYKSFQMHKQVKRELYTDIENLFRSNSDILRKIFIFGIIAFSLT